MNLRDRVQERMRLSVPPKARVLCAISGGPDSVALAHLLKHSSPGLVLGHVDHQLRTSSARDARFVQTLAKRWDLPYKVMRIRVPAHAESRKRGLEEAARDLRYKALVKMAENTGCSIIATAHNANDQAETILMNFLRGAGPLGLAGIPPVRSLNRKVRVVRPLLDVTREEIMAYLRGHRIPWRLDPTNKSARFTRNRIRHRVLPLLEKEYPGLKRRLAGLAEIFREEQAFWDPQIQREIRKTVRQNKQTITVDLAGLLGYHKALGRRILRHLLTGISFQDTERIFHLARSSKEHLPLQLSGGLQVERIGKKLIIPRDFYEQS